MKTSTLSALVVVTSLATATGALAWIEQELAPLLTGPATAMAGPVIVHTLA